MLTKTRIIRTTLALLVALCGSAANNPRDATAGPETDGSSRLGPFVGNPFFWQYEGRPVLLLGGSDDDNLFQWDEEHLREQLDRMVEIGANYIRNVMSSRDHGNVRAFKRLENGKYDLDQWNQEYWRRFNRMLELTAEREIFVQIELWDQWDHVAERWNNDPWNPDQNVNYSTSGTSLGGDGHYDDVRATTIEKHDLFLTVPGVNNDETVLAYQQKFIDKVLSCTFEHDHVLYTVTNELFDQHPTAWSLYWTGYVKRRAREAGVDIEITEMFQTTDLTADQHRASLDHPELFDFLDISQNSVQDDDRHWDRLQWIRRRLTGHPRPINHTKTYGGSMGSWAAGPDHGIERFWRNIIGGAASCRFHRPPAGIGLSEQAQTHIRGARMLLEEIDIFKCEPDAEHHLLSERDDDRAYLTAIPGEQYAVYFPQGGSVTLDLTAADGEFLLKWLQIERSRWTAGGHIRGGGRVTLSAPGAGNNWCAVLTFQQEKP